MRRHALRYRQTEYSTEHLVNGARPPPPARLSDEGARSCQRAWAVPPLDVLGGWIAEPLPALDMENCRDPDERSDAAI